MEPILTRGSLPHEAEEAIDSLIALTEYQEDFVVDALRVTDEARTIIKQVTTHSSALLMSLIDTSLSFHSLQVQFLRHLAWVMTIRMGLKYDPPVQDAAWFEQVSYGIRQSTLWRIGDAMDRPIAAPPYPTLSSTYHRCQFCGNYYTEGTIHLCSTSFSSSSTEYPTANTVWASNTYNTLSQSVGTGWVGGRQVEPNSVVTDELGNISGTFNDGVTFTIRVDGSYASSYTPEIVEITSMGDAERRFTYRRPLQEAPRQSEGGRFTRNTGGIYEFNFAPDFHIDSYAVVDGGPNTVSYEQIRRLYDELSQPAVNPPPPDPESGPGASF
jgi:hypothetical protein